MHFRNFFSQSGSLRMRCRTCATMPAAFAASIPDTQRVGHDRERLEASIGLTSSRGVPLMQF
ncbi:hypothetical protein BDP81DRAFT_434722 [Colletotrichum phormii]|uniref:Uncharacterized protein n=1 Tax=Colletotrichum phormii TaxID=359342 RepID=A0AAI9ZJW5_9PEZI|nr:uncharacterized protein BDP81DRAFT_434722 [Colletotrichum phormii]KAK1633346.1 hypothetical protein BDP81DRAFT_434722 [Colletotrichum phormii]